MFFFSYIKKYIPTYVYNFVHRAAKANQMNVVVAVVCMYQQKTRTKTTTTTTALKTTRRQHNSSGGVNSSSSRSHSRALLAAVNKAGRRKTAVFNPTSLWCARLYVRSPLSPHNKKKKTTITTTTASAHFENTHTLNSSIK